MVFLKELFEKVNFEKNQQMTMSQKACKITMEHAKSNFSFLRKKALNSDYSLEWQQRIHFIQYHLTRLSGIKSIKNCRKFEEI